jgi:tetratricopeptide (TPR) repeat protein
LDLAYLTFYRKVPRVSRQLSETNHRDHEDSDDERLDTSLAEARNPNEVVLHDYTSFIDFVPEEAMKRILFNISRHRPVNEEDERKLIGWLRNATNLAEATSRWGKGGMVAGALCLEAMLCLSRVFEGAARDDDGARQYLERAFQLAQQAVKAAPPDSADGAHARDVLSEVMFLVCTQGDDAEDDAQADARIEAAIRATKEARDAAAAASLDTERRAIAARLAELLKMRFERSETQEDLDEAIACATPLLDMPPEDDEDLPDTLHMLTELYAEKILHFRVATRDEMDAAVGYATDWLESVNDRSLRRMRTLILAGRLISWRFLRSRDGNIDELNRALEFQKEGLALAGPDATDRAWRSYRRELLGDTASMLVTRFRAEGSRADLEEAMRLAIQGRDMTGCSGPEWKCTLALLRARDAKYNLTLDEAELDMGLKEAEAVLHLDGLDKDAKASMFNVLCDAYTNRYRVSSNEEDINKAIEYGTEAAKLYPRELSFATSLGVAMILSYERTGKGSDFRKAMTRVAKVVQAGDGVHNGDLGHMVKASLLRIYRRSKKAVFLDYAVNTMQASVRKTPTHQSQYEMHVSDLAECLIQRYDSDKEKYADDLDHGIRVSEASLKLRVINAHYRSTTLENLGMLYQRKYEAMAPGARDEGTLRKAIHYFRLGWEHASADSAARIKCGRAAAQLLGIVGEWRAAADILTACVRMLPRVTGLASGDGNQQHVMKRYGGLASSCAEALMNANATAETDGDRDGEPTKHEEGEPAYGALAALRYLELGRSIISRLSLEQSAEVDLLRQHDAQLADAYLEARKKLYTFAGLPEDHQEDNSTTLSPIAAAKYKRRVRIEEEFEAVCRRIRGKPGLEHFLLPPQTAEMQAAARNGIIVVVNVGKQRSDAFLISNAGVKPKQLDGVDEESVATVKGQGMPVLMEWLWHHVASPILSAAAVPEVADGRWLRVWWVLTGPLTGVPIHAAGLGGGSNQDSVLDRVMSSYATSVMSLLYARRITKTIPSGPSDTTTSTSAGAQQQQHYQALLVSMGVTPGNKYGDLPQADNEVRAVEAQLHHGGRYSFQPVVAALADKTHAACLAALRSSSIFHFAGHAKVDQRVPSRSALLLTDHESEPLTMAAIRDDGSEETDQDRGTESGMLESPPRFLAYLSACSTGAVGDPSLADEAIHLVAGMQLARFRHVVGTLWEVADWYCVQIAVKFYRRLLHSDACQDGGDGILSDDGVCRALHEAIREVREGRFERTRRTRGEEGGQEHLDPLDTLDGPDGEAGLEAFPELGPSRFGIGVSPLEAPADSHLTRQWNATHIARWAPYVHYGV